jgi:hypothetical protein
MVALMVWGSLETILLVTTRSIPKTYVVKNQSYLQVPTHYYSIPSDTIEIGTGLYMKQTEYENVVALYVIHSNVSDQGDYSYPSCSSPIMEDLRWRKSEDYIIDLDNNRGLTSSFITQAFATATQTWQTHIPIDVFGNQLTGQVDEQLSYNGKNEIIFGSIENQNAIAVTVIYMACSVPIVQNQCAGTKSIVEWKQIYNTELYDWGDATQDSTVMDLLNIITHELGHMLGLADIYKSTCTEATMYGYATNGEIKKRTLDNQDVQGIQTLYGTSDSSEDNGEDTDLGLQSNSLANLITMNMLLVTLLVLLVI